MATVPEMLALARKHHQAGNLQQAQQLYDQILAIDPYHADAHNQLGFLWFQIGKSDLAAQFIRRAIALRPGVAGYHSNLGLALDALGQWEDAVGHLRESVRLDPRFAGAQNNLANTLRHLGRLEEAVACYREAIRLLPGDAGVICNLAGMLATLHRREEAAAQYRQALHIQPTHAESHFGLGNVLLDMGQTDAALESFQQALAYQPGHVKAHLQVGNIRFAQQRHDEAAKAFRLALHHEPEHAEAYKNLETFSEVQRKFTEAESHFREALRIDPNMFEAIKLLGDVCLELMRDEEALQCFQKTIALAPNDVEAQLGIGNAFAKLDNLQEALSWFDRVAQQHPQLADPHVRLAWVHFRLGRPELAAASYRRALELDASLANAQHDLLFCLNYDPHADAETVFAEHRRWGKLQETAADLQPHANSRLPERRLRIGYLSPDFRDHALVRYFEPVMRRHDPKQVEVHCYAENNVSDEATERLQRVAAGWSWTAAISDTQLAQRIRADQIDILVDLAGHTAKSRVAVMAHKPAPIQATWLGYMNTTGLTAVDYRITDAVLDPPGQPVLDTEELWRLPEGFCCFMPPQQTPPVAALPAGRMGNLTFGSLNNLVKLNNDVLQLWSEILTALPTSRLLIYQHSITDATTECFRRQFAAFGISGDRLDLRRAAIVPGYLKIYDEFDVSLDAFPATGGVTTCESLWMGVPMLSLCGQRPVGRQSAALLHRVGLGDWAVSSRNEYVQFALKLAKDLDRLTGIRETLRERMAGAWCDSERFTRHLEAAYRAMWRRWCGA